MDGETDLTLEQAFTLGEGESLVKVYPDVKVSPLPSIPLLLGLASPALAGVVLPAIGALALYGFLFWAFAKRELHRILLTNHRLVLLVERRNLFSHEIISHGVDPSCIRGMRSGWLKRLFYRLGTVELLLDNQRALPFGTIDTPYTASRKVWRTGGALLNLILVPLVLLTSLVLKLTLPWKIPRIPEDIEELHLDILNLEEG